MAGRKRVGIFGWGIVAPRSPDVDTFERNLECATSWLAPFEGYGPSHFLVGMPEFELEVYKPWIDERFEPRKYGQVSKNSGRTIQFAIGAFIQALGQNPGLEQELQALGHEAHVYVGTCLGDFALHHDVSIEYDRAQRHWSKFWCGPEHNPKLADYRASSPATRRSLREQLGAPPDPADLDPEDPDQEVTLAHWLDFWIERSEGLRKYLAELQQIEAEGIQGDVETQKGHVIRRKVTARRQLSAAWGCPAEPWGAIDPRLLWNIPNVPAAQITMLGRITGPSLAPIAACAGFSTALKLADNAIQSGQAKAVVLGACDPEPHAISVGAFFGARVLSHDGQTSKPFTTMRGTHISGGACVWIVGDADYLMAKGMKPLGLEILSVALTSDAEHIITPSADGPRRAIREALAEAGVAPEDVATWDMHATATPGDWQELQNALAIFGGGPKLTARKGSFGHGMSVCGGWELTAQHLGFAKGMLHPVYIEGSELHPSVAPYHDSLVRGEGAPVEGKIAGKINMGVGGINACVICQRWEHPAG